MDKHEHGNLGQIIGKALRFKVCLAEREVLPHGCSYDGALAVGAFLFGCNAHSTGITTHVYIENPKTKETLEIISGTYWFNESRYGFNKFKREHGKWDEALKEAIETIVAETDKAEAEYNAEQAEFQRVKDEKEQKTKESFECIF